MKKQKRFVVTIPMELWFELIDAAAECYQKDEARDCTPESFAIECITNELAARRLDRRKPKRASFAEKRERAPRVGLSLELQEMTA